MALPFRTALRVALEHPVGFVCCLVAVGFEFVLRASVFVGTNLLFALSIPPVSFVLLGVAALDYRSKSEPLSVGDAVAVLRERGGALFGYVFVGHVIAVLTAVPLFVLLAGGVLTLDTGIRFVRYWLGSGTILDPFLALFAVRFFLLGAVVLAWVGLASGLVYVANDASVLGGLRNAARTIAGDLRMTGTLVAVAIGGFAVLSVAGVALALGTAGDQQPVGVLATVLSMVVFGGLLAGVLLALVSGRTDSRTAPPPVDLDGTTVARVAVAVLLVVALIAGAGAIRVTETRPVADAAPVSVEQDATVIYASARDNTLSMSHRVVRTGVTPGEDDEVAMTRVHDWEDRQYRISIESGDDIDIDGYFSTGVMYAGTFGAADRWGVFAQSTGDGAAIAVPGYAIATIESDAEGLPDSFTGEWELRERDGQELHLRLDDSEAAVEAVHGSVGDATYNEGWVEMTVDAERGIVTGGEARANVTDTDGEDLLNQHTRWSVETDVDMERPEAAGEPTPIEWLWRYVIY